MVRTRRAWTAPRHGRAEFELDHPTVFCSLLGSHGQHLVILGVSTNNVQTLLGSDDGNVTIKVRSFFEELRADLARFKTTTPWNHVGESWLR